jgi:hypothetical protein
MITPDGWVDWAIRVPNAIQWKVYGKPNEGDGIACHSQEGYGLWVMVQMQNDPHLKRSFMFWMNQLGTLYQFVPVTASAWTSGTYYGNTHYWPLEMEGLHYQPLNPAQSASLTRLIHEWSAYKGMVPTRWALPHGQWLFDGREMPTLVEHREIDQIEVRNAGPTACPSNRYSQYWKQMEDIEMEEYKELVMALLLTDAEKVQYAGGLLSRDEHDGLPKHGGAAAAVHSHGAIPTHTHTAEVTLS